MSTWKWLWSPSLQERIFNVGINADGTLHNPNGYNEVEVRQLVAEAEARHHAKRSKAAKKAAATRKQRIEQKVYLTAQRILDGWQLEPRKNCRICGKGVSDEPSIRRGIGSDCWQRVLASIQARKAAS
jgi:hypothetical protein